MRDEKIVESADLVDAGVIFGTGFAPFRGGPLHYARRRSRGLGAPTRRRGIGLISRAPGAVMQGAVRMSQSLRRVAVIGGVRIPFCRSNTLYADLSNLEMLTTTLNGLVDRYKLAGPHIDEVVGGAVVTHSKDWNIAREAVIGTKLARTTPGITLMQACGTSLQAAIGIAAKIAAGEIECGIGMGSDTTSDAPIVFSKRFSQRLVQVQQAKSLGQRLDAFKGFSLGELAPQPPSVAEPRTGLSMGQHAELMAQEWKVTRQEQDQLAFDSHKKAAEAYRAGYMDDLIVPCAGVFRDNNIREDISLESLATLKPAFDRSARGTLTAANSTPLTDGASSVLLASEEWAMQRACRCRPGSPTPRRQPTTSSAGEGLLMAPTIAVSRCWSGPGSGCRTSTSTRSTRRSPRRCWQLSRPGRIPSIASACSARARRSGPLIATGSTSKAPRWRSAILSRQPARASWPTSPSCCRRWRPGPHLRLHRRRHGGRRHHGERQGRGHAAGRLTLNSPRDSSA